MDQEKEQRRGKLSLYNFPPGPPERFRHDPILLSESYQLYHLCFYIKLLNINFLDYFLVFPYSPLMFSVLRMGNV